MSDTAIKNLVILGGGILLLGALLLERPGYLASPSLLGTLIVAELVLAAMCNYRQIFFPVVLGAFLWAGVGVPLASAWVMGRWFVLLIAALALREQAPTRDGKGRVAFAEALRFPDQRRPPGGPGFQQSGLGRNAIALRSTPLRPVGRQQRQGKQ